MPSRHFHQVQSALDSKIVRNAHTEDNLYSITPPPLLTARHQRVSQRKWGCLLCRAHHADHADQPTWNSTESIFCAPELDVFSYFCLSESLTKNVRRCLLYMPDALGPPLMVSLGVILGAQTALNKVQLGIHCACTGIWYLVSGIWYHLLSFVLILGPTNFDQALIVLLVMNWRFLQRIESNAKCYIHCASVSTHQQSDKKGDS